MTIALILGYWRRGGWRLRSADRLISFALVIFLIPVTLGLLGLLATSIWSVSKSWFFPSALPSEFSFIHWQEATNIFSLVANSLYLASASTFLSIVIVLMWVYRLKDLK